MAAGFLTCGSSRDVRVFPSRSATVTGDPAFGFQLGFRLIAFNPRDRVKPGPLITKTERALLAYSGETVWVLHPASLTVRVGVGLWQRV